MSTIVNINGALFPREQAVIPVFDRQFLYGDGIYETLRTFGGHPFLLGPHLRRLHHSAEALELPLRLSDAELRLEIVRTLEAAGNEESVIRVMVTRGEGEVGLDPALGGEPNVIIMVRPFTPMALDVRLGGVEVAVPTVRRNSPRAIPGNIKTGNYLNQVMALGQGRKKGAYEVVMLNEQGAVAEGSTSNLFFVEQGGLYTPSLETGILPGVTRALVLGIARELGIPTEEGRYSLGRFLGADEAFLTSTLKDVLPIRACEGRALGPTCPGSVTLRLLEGFEVIAESARVGQLSEEKVEALLAGG